MRHASSASAHDYLRWSTRLVRLRARPDNVLTATAYRGVLEEILAIRATAELVAGWAYTMRPAYEQTTHALAELQRPWVSTLHKVFATADTLDYDKTLAAAAALLDLPYAEVAELVWQCIPWYATVIDDAGGVKRYHQVLAQHQLCAPNSGNPILPAAALITATIAHGRSARARRYLTRVIERDFPHLGAMIDTWVAIAATVPPDSWHLARLDDNNALVGLGPPDGGDAAVVVPLARHLIETVHHTDTAAHEDLISRTQALTPDQLAMLALLFADTVGLMLAPMHSDHHGS